MKKLYVILFILFVSCNTKFIALKMPVKNPTAFTFNANMSEVKKAIKLNFSKLEFNDMILRFKENSNSFSEDIFKIEANKNDAYLYTNQHINSSLYFKDTIPLYYLTSFHLHIDSIDDNHTLVTINAIEPQIITGFEFLGLQGAFYRKPDIRLVEPSTVEEYEILLRIGNALGEKGMPAIIMPDKQKREVKKRWDFPKYIYKSKYTKKENEKK